MHRPRFAIALLLCGGLAGLSSAALASTPDADFLFVGSYHMGNPGRDIQNTRADDVRVPRRQQELAEIAATLERYRPTKVMVEVPVDRQSQLDQRYAASCRGERPMAADETEQLGFRIACALGQHTVYAVDHDELTPVQDDDSIDFVKAVARYHQQPQYDAYLAEGKAVNDTGQAILAHGRIGDMLRYLNSPEWLHWNATAYYQLGLLGTPDDPVGARWVQSWFGRNLAIFNSIDRNTRAGDRILVIYGAGHGNFLRQLASDAGRYRVHDPLDWLPPPAPDR